MYRLTEKCKFVYLIPSILSCYFIYSVLYISGITAFSSCSVKPSHGTFFFHGIKPETSGVQSHGIDCEYISHNRHAKRLSYVKQLKLCSSEKRPWKIKNPVPSDMCQVHFK